LRIGIDVRPIGGASGRRGVGTYVRELVGALFEEAREDEIVLFHADAGSLPAEWSLPRPGVAPVLLGRPRRAATVWDQIAWPGTLARRRIDVFHSPFWTLPLLSTQRCALVQTIHDLTPIKYSGSVSMKDEMIFRANFACARRARRVIVPSRSTLADAVSLARIASERIRVVPEGVALPPDLLARAEAALPALRDRLALKGRYLLHTGGQDRIKNLAVAVRAVAILARGGHDVRIAVTGEKGAEAGAIRREAAAAGAGERLVLTGYVDRVDLIALYRGAAALVYPSRNEGFGLPLLEAMACGTPVVAARAGALPEVGGGSCLYADPDDAEAFAGAAAAILADDALARRLSEEGRVRARGFTWKEAARRTLAIYREAAER